MPNYSENTLHVLQVPGIPGSWFLKKGVCSFAGIHRILNMFKFLYGKRTRLVSFMAALCLRQLAVLSISSGIITSSLKTALLSYDGKTFTWGLESKYHCVCSTALYYLSSLPTHFNYFFPLDCPLNLYVWLFCFFGAEKSGLWQPWRICMAKGCSNAVCYCLLLYCLYFLVGLPGPTLHIFQDLMRSG